MRCTKAHAYGNDFLYVEAEDAARDGRAPALLARLLCDRHHGLGGDGLILHGPTDAGARMRLINADGSPSEVSGNGVRGLAAIVARRRTARGAVTPPRLTIDTDAGPKVLTLLEADGERRFLFEAAMGEPAGLRRLALDVAGEHVTVVALSVGNPQCVLIEPPDEARLARLGPALQVHPAFPNGVNVEMAEVVAPDLVRILIWERGVGPTLSSGTGSCAAAIAASAYGGAAREVTVEAPGGAQRVAWRPDGVWLTGWAEVVFEGTWLG